MPDAIADAQVLLDAATLNRQDPCLDGCLLRLPDYGQLVMTGDIHGHQRNFAKLKKYADLQHAPARHVILHEVIHVEHNGPMGNDNSHQLMIEAARWKIEFPDQIHVLHSNHEMSQLTGKEICKGGRVVNLDFEQSLAATYGSKADCVLDAIREYIASFALAARTHNRMFLSHSLPNMSDLAAFDPTILQRPLGLDDFRDGGDAYLIVWGRHHPSRLLEQLADIFDVDWFLCGHQPQESGSRVLHNRMIILASDHNHGAFLPFDLKKSYTIQELSSLIRPFAAIG